MNRRRNWLAGLFAAPSVVLLTFLLAAWIGSSLPRNPHWREPASGIEIMVETNGVHTAIVMPLVTSQKDWRGAFPAADVAASDRPYTHVSVGWGEREVFLNTPRWVDLDPATAWNAVVGGEGLFHIGHYVRPAPGPDIRPLTLSEEQYRRLVATVERRLPPPGQRRTYPGYGEWDVFYDAPGSYSVGNTCNQWTSDTLAAAGIRIGRWTPFAGGVMKWIDAEPALPRRAATRQ